MKSFLIEVKLELIIRGLYDPKTSAPFILTSIKLANKNKAKPTYSIYGRPLGTREKVDVMLMNPQPKTKEEIFCYFQNCKYMGRVVDD